jgi:N-hydroxyarylamine O-acetyltransferase
MDDKSVEAYLERIGADRPAVLDGPALGVLHRAHLRTVPFENLSLHLGERVSLAPDDLVEKIVTRRRGGFCYELNGGFALLLRALGAEVELAAAAVFDGDALGPPFDHLALVVRLPDGSRWLVDVGFGDHSVYPLDLADGREQADPSGRFQVVQTAGGDLDVLRDGKPQYRLEPRPRRLSDFGPTCWYQQTSPSSHFTRSTICSRLTDTGRISLSGRTLIRTEDGTRTEEQLPSDQAVLAGYRDHFGVVLDRVPEVRPAQP